MRSDHVEFILANLELEGERVIWKNHPNRKDLIGREAGYVAKDGERVLRMRGAEVKISIIKKVLHGRQ